MAEKEQQINHLDESNKPCFGMWNTLMDSELNAFWRKKEEHRGKWFSQIIFDFVCGRHRAQNLVYASSLQAMTIKQKKKKHCWAQNNAPYQINI